MLSVHAPSVRKMALFLGLLALLVTTVALPGGAGAQASQDIIIPVRGAGIWS